MSSILLIDDHALVREGTKATISRDGRFNVVAEAADAASALQMALRHQPDLTLLDLSLDRDSGLRLLPQLHVVSPATRVLIMSMHDDPGLILRAFELGAQGYISKATMPEELASLLLVALRGDQVLSRDLAARTPDTRHVELTKRERETLSGLLSGHAPKALALEMGISDKTLYRHRANLMEKLGVSNDVELARRMFDGWQ